MQPGRPLSKCCFFQSARRYPRTMKPGCGALGIGRIVIVVGTGDMVIQAPQYHIGMLSIED
jgi:hypothetical protein